MAKKPRQDMNACTDALFMVLKGHFLAFACKELGIENVDFNLNHLIFTSASTVEKLRFIVCLSIKVVEICTIISDTLLRKDLICIHEYTHFLTSLPGHMLPAPVFIEANKYIMHASIGEKQ